MTLPELTRNDIPLPWQTNAWKQLLARYRSNNMPHAIRVTGQVGLGKFLLAQALANLLLCSSDAEVACGDCHACHLFAAKTHPDWSVIQPEGKSQSIVVDQIRTLSESLYQTPQLAHNKVILIEPAEAMNTSAANALLKGLEEPGRDTYLILVDHQTLPIMATLRSRCQTVVLHPPAFHVAQAWLQQWFAQNEIENLLKLSMGAPMLARTYGENNVGEKFQEFQSDLHALQQKDRTPLSMAADWKDLDAKLLMNFLLGLMLDTIRQEADTGRKMTHSFTLYDKVCRLRQTSFGASSLNWQMCLEDLFSLWQTQKMDAMK